MNMTMISEYGGPASLSKGWAKSLLKCMNFTRRVRKTKAKISPEHFKELELQFLQDIVDVDHVVKMEDILPQLILIGTKQG